MQLQEETLTHTHTSCLPLFLFCSQFSNWRQIRATNLGTNLSARQTNWAEEAAKWNNK